MVQQVKLVLGALLSMALLVGALWAWDHPMWFWPMAARPEIATWAIRLAAISVVAAAQGLLLLTVVRAMFDRDRVDRVLRLSAAFASAVCLVSAVALALAAR